MLSSGEIVCSSFRITYNDDVVVIVPVEKAFMRFQAKEFDRIFSELQAAKYCRFILDFSKCDYISSEGLASTSLCWKWCHDDDNGKMAAIIPQDTENEVRNLFEIIGLSRMIGNALQPTLADALKYLKEFA